MYKQAIPRDFYIAPDNILGNIEGDNVAQSVKNQGSNEKRALLELSYSGNIFGRGYARSVFFEPDSTSMILTPSLSQGFTGKWIIKVNSNTKFIGFLVNMESERTQGGSIRTYEFIDVLQGWDVLQTNKIYPATSNSGYTVHNLLNDMVYNAISLSEIQLHSSHVPPNSTLLTDLYEEGFYSVTNSTYLAEIQKICQALGYVVFCDPGFGDVTILNPFDMDRGTLDFDFDSVIDAGFSIDYLSMPSTILVNDDINLKGLAYGHLGTGSNLDDTVYNFTRINNLTFATTLGIKEDSLSSVAQKLYNIGKKQARVLTLRKAGDEYSSTCLGQTIYWTDSKGGTGTYTVSSYETIITPRSYITTYKGYVSI